MSTTPDARPVPTDRSYSLRLLIAWLWVGIPLAWGVYQTAATSLALFR